MAATRPLRDMLAPIHMAQPEGFPLRRRFFPMGFPVEIFTNSAEVVSIAGSIWAPFAPLANASPIELRIEISESSAAPLPSPPCHADHLMAIVQGPDNFAIADMISGIGVIRAGHAAVRDAAWFIYHFLEPVAYVLLGARHFAMVHASCIAIGNEGVLLCGAAGAGKTCLAYACATRGWSFLSGDAIQLIRRASEPVVVGRPFSIRFRSSARTLFPELRDYHAGLRANGKCDLELDPRELGLTAQLSARAALIAFLDRTSDSRPCVQPIWREEARHALSESIRAGDAHIRAQQQAALDRLLECPCVRLTYSDPFEAERCLRRTLARM